MEIYANASVNKRNEARCINSCSMSGKGDSFCTVGPARKMSGRKPPFLRNLRRVRKRARRGEGRRKSKSGEKVYERERERVPPSRDLSRSRKKSSSSDEIGSWHRDERLTRRRPSVVTRITRGVASTTDRLDVLANYDD